MSDVTRQPIVIDSTCLGLGVKAGVYNKTAKLHTEPAVASRHVVLTVPVMGSTRSCFSQLRKIPEIPSHLFCLPKELWQIRTHGA